MGLEVAIYPHVFKRNFEGQISWSKGWLVKKMAYSFSARQYLSIDIWLYPKVLKRNLTNNKKLSAPQISNLFTKFSTKLFIPLFIK